MSGVFYVIGGACILVAVLILIAVVSYNHVVAKPVKRNRKDIQQKKEFPSETTVLTYEAIGRQSPVKKKNKDSIMVIGSSLSGKTGKNDTSPSYFMDEAHMITIPYEEERQSHRNSSFDDSNNNDSYRHSDNSYSSSSSYSSSDSGGSDSGGGGGSD